MNYKLWNRGKLIAKIELYLSEEQEIKKMIG